MAANGRSERSTTLTSTCRRSTSGIVELRRLEDAWPPLGAEDRATQDGLAASREGARPRPEGARKRHARPWSRRSKRTGDASVLARLEAAAASYTREDAELARLDGELVEARKTVDGADQGAQASLSVACSKPGKRLRRSPAPRREAEEQLKLSEAVGRCAEAEARLANFDKELAEVEPQAASSVTERTRRGRDSGIWSRSMLLSPFALGLAPGDHCPVCDSIIEVLPERDDEIASRLR